MDNRATPEEIRHSIDLVTKVEIRSWIQVGHVLDQVERSGFWQGQAASFSEWLRSFASRLGLKEASMWRYLASARYYETLHDDLTKRGIECPRLVGLSASVSPENLELLAKFERAAPSDVYEEIAARVVHGSITRAEMRKVWSAYRPVLAGRTARGSGIPAPKANFTDPVQYDSMVEANIFKVLMLIGPAWMRSDKPYLYKIFHHVTPEFKSSKFRFQFDAVVMTSKSRRAATEYHGIEIRGDNRLQDMEFLERLERQRPYCHFLWIALEGHSSDARIYRTPQHVGLLAISCGHVRVLRQAVRGDGELSGDLAKGLLVYSLGR